LLKNDLIFNPPGLKRPSLYQFNSLLTFCGQYLIDTKGSSSYTRFNQRAVSEEQIHSTENDSAFFP
jgi:hypothetical protein